MALQTPNHRPKLFISPRPSYKSWNGYIANLADSLSGNMNVLNREPILVRRSIDLLRNFYKADVLLLNWPEDIPSLKFGLIQSVLFNFLVVLARLKGSKIIWVCHNRKSHHKEFPKFNQLNRAFFKKIAHKILVHSGDAQEHLAKEAQKVFYLPHPRYERLEPKQIVLPASLTTHSDVLIWGAIKPYKGLEKFIEEYRKSGSTFHTLIIGKAKPDYHHQLQSFAKGTNIRIENCFLNDDELSVLFSQTKIVLLPYLLSDTFSSGALIHSLNSHKIVIGPEIGNFIDLRAENACLTYTNYKHLFATISDLLSNEAQYDQTLQRLRKGMDHYYDNNSWDQFADKLCNVLFPGMVASKPFANRSIFRQTDVMTADSQTERP